MIDDDFGDDDLTSSTTHIERGLMAPRQRWTHFARITAELCIGSRYIDDYSPRNVAVRSEGMQDLCYRLYSCDVAFMAAAELGITVEAWRLALDHAIQHSFTPAPE